MIGYLLPIGLVAAFWVLTLYIAFLYGQMTVHFENIQRNVESIEENLMGDDDR